MIRVSGWFSGIQTQMEFSVGMFIRGGLRISTCGISGEETDKGRGKKSSWNAVQMNLADSVGALE